MNEYCRLVNGTIFASSDYGVFECDTWFMTRGYIDLIEGNVFMTYSEIGGITMKNARNRQMLFGSWTGNAIAEAAVANIGDSTGITAVTVTAATFGTKVNGLSGEYVFTYENSAWMINGEDAGTIATTYGITVTGTAAAGDIIVVDYTAASGAWEAIGKDNDDLSKELNPDVETNKNVLGEATVQHSGYEPEISVDPYYIDPSRKMYAHLREIAMEEKYSEADCMGYIAEAYFTAANPVTKKMTGYCYVRQAYFVPQSVGGDTAAFAIPVNIYPVGGMVKKKIVYDMATNEATITTIS